jgi:hypothetical protein
MHTVLAAIVIRIFFFVIISCRNRVRRCQYYLCYADEDFSGIQRPFEQVDWNL